MQRVVNRQKACNCIKPSGGKNQPSMTGQLAWLAWLGVHLTLFNGVEQKISTFVDWVGLCSPSNTVNA
jgi:hypothetical protein